MKATKENVKVGSKVTYTNKFNYTTSGTITKITDKSVWLNGMRNSWNTLSKFDVI